MPRETMRPVPVMPSPELTDEHEKGKVAEALEAEQLAYNYKFEEEEMLSIFDEMKACMTYENIVRSKYFSELPGELQENIQRHHDQAKKADPQNKYLHNILHEDFDAILSFDEDVFLEFLEGSLKGLEYQKAKEKKTEEKISSHDVDEQIRFRIAGKYLRFVDLSCVYSELEEKLESYTDEDRAKIKNYYEGVMPSVLQTNEARTDLTYEKVAQSEKFSTLPLEFQERILRHIEHTQKSDKYRDSRHPLIDEDFSDLQKLDPSLIFDLVGDDDFIKHKGAVIKMSTISTGMGVIKASSNESAARGDEETAKILGVKEDRLARRRRKGEKIIHGDLGVKVKTGIEELHREFGNLVNKDNLAAYVNYHEEMVNLYELLQKGQIVETDAMKKYIEDAMTSLTKQPPTVVYFHGDFGTGKTALAVHIAKTRLKSVPIIVSGSKFLDPDRFTEEFRLSAKSQAETLNEINAHLGFTNKISENSPDDIIVSHAAELRQQIEESALARYTREEYLHNVGGEQNFNQADFDKFEVEYKPDENYLMNIRKEIDSLMSNPVQGRYVLGAMYTAMKEGKPLIIDEANAISPDVLIAFNDMLTKKAGQSIQSRAGDFTVKEGFCVMWTGNTGDRYKVARYNDMDPASYSRIHPIQVKYLPQSQEVNSMKQLLGRLDLDQLSEKLFDTQEEAMQVIKDSKDKAKADQIFQVLLVKLLGSRLGAELLVEDNDRNSVFKDTYRLSMGARIIMDMFEKTGKITEMQLLKGDAGGIFNSYTSSNIMEKLNKANLTMRELIDNIVGQYLDEGTNMDIEYYAYKYVRKYDQYPDQQAIIYAVLNTVGFFKTKDGWPNVQNIPGKGEAEKLRNFQNIINIDLTDGAINKYKKIDQNGDVVTLLNTDRKYHLEYFSSLETLQLLFGYLPPKTKQQYENIQAVHEREQRSGIEVSQLEKDRLEKIDLIKQVVDVLKADRSFFADSSEIKKFADQVKGFKFSQPEWRDAKSVPDEEWDAELDNFYNLILDWFMSKKTISPEQRQAVAQQGAEGKEALIKQVLNIK